MKYVAIVTGASRGIGAAAAERLAADGLSIVVNYQHDRISAEKVVEQIQASGGQARAVCADVTSESDVVRLFEAAAEMGELRTLVNNAGILRPQMRLQEMGLDRIKAVFEANVFGVFLCCKQAITMMPEHGGASIINVSSISSKSGSPNEYVDYAASKGAVDSLTVGLAKELAVRGIRVNAVRPGMIRTDIHATGGEPNRVSRLASSIPLKRGGEAHEVAEIIAWLASEKATYCTGALYDVTGGL